DLLDSLNGLGGIAIVDDVVRAERFGVFELRVVYIRSDDAGRCEHSKQLDRHVAETADADDDDGAVGVEVRQRTLDRVIRRERGVAQDRKSTRLNSSHVKTS